MSARENIAKNIIQQLENMTDPAPNFVTREHFDVQKLAITQYPAVLVYTANEDREDISTDERQATITFQLRCFLRGNELDTQRNIHPDLSVEMGDTAAAIKLTSKLRDDIEFYNECSKNAQLNYQKHHSEEVVNTYLNKFFNSL